MARDDATVSWQGHDLDFTDVVFDGGDLPGAVFTGATVSFRGARFVGGTVNFGGARFEGGTVTFIGATGRRPEQLPDGMADHLSQ